MDQKKKKPIPYITSKFYNHKLRVPSNIQTYTATPYISSKFYKHIPQKYYNFDKSIPQAYITSKFYNHTVKNYNSVPYITSNL